MKISMILIKNTIKIVFDFIKKSLFLCNLTNTELQGHIVPISKLRFMPKTKLAVPYSLGRTCRGVSFNKSFNKDTFGNLWLAIFNGTGIKEASDDLTIKMKKEKNLRASDVVNLQNNVNLRKYPAWAFVLPWDNVSVQEKFESFPGSFYRNRSQNGLYFKNSSRQLVIDTMYSVESVKSKVNQMQRTMESIRKNGLKRNFDAPNIHIFIDGSDWRWAMGDSGNHRSFICSMLGHETLEVRLSSIIYKNKVNSWKNVKNGTYSVEEAEYIFDSYFEGSDVVFGASI